MKNMKMPKRLTIQEMNDYRDRMKNAKNNQNQENTSTNREKKSSVFERIGQSKVVRIIKNGILIVVSLIVGAVILKALTYLLEAAKGFEAAVVK